MTRPILPSRILKLVVVVSVALLKFTDVTVDAFASFSTRGSILHSSLHHGSDHRCRSTLNKLSARLWAQSQQITIRDWRSNGNEPESIYELLLEQRREQAQTTNDDFDPEGSLELDVLNRLCLQESYSKEDGGCFLVAVAGDCNDHNDDDENGDKRKSSIVGTLGMITGTQVVYQSSGSSVSEPEVAAAIRRVCSSWSEDEDDGTAKQGLTKQVSTTTLLEDLIREGEQRAIQSGATRIIGLAYPETTGAAGEKARVAKPSTDLFESLGYRRSDQQLPGVKTLQYEKKLSRNEALANSNAVLTESSVERWILPAAIVGLVSLGYLVFNLYSNVFGIEQLWGSSDNAGIGTSLSTQNLQDLIRDEKLGRSGLDDGISSYASTRQWEDLSPEELREEQALMKVIQGQSIRFK
ncbi:unnamed protein product [Pseudo-nitzschia multistriata]|uniref:Uncharacterized protein n=1 Tax=Pseudo-nitzschia multistriata TaxID=183589 RepID=A0A448Z5Z6_9STRA|nr:unnamed protein product [Pseudo-nitzschia multistriata]